MIRVLIENCPGGITDPGSVVGAVAFTWPTGCAAPEYTVNFLQATSRLGSLEKNEWAELKVPVRANEGYYELLARALTEFLKTRPTNQGEKP